MKLQELIKAITGGKGKPTTTLKTSQTSTELPEKTITTSCNTEVTAVEETIPQATKALPSSKITTRKTKATRSKHVKDDELDDEIKRTQNRLVYLRNRKKTGVAGGDSRKSKLKKYGADYAYYTYWVKDRNFTVRYKQLRDDMTVTAKRFVAYHNRIMEVVNKFGTEQEKYLLNKIMGNVNETIDM